MGRAPKPSSEAKLLLDALSDLPDPQDRLLRGWVKTLITDERRSIRIDEHSYLCRRLQEEGFDEAAMFLLQHEDAGAARKPGKVKPDRYEADERALEDWGMV